ncbi:DUF952 domain-containing protein [Paracoccus liaowanqingii]|uniref:DUF952 domain-containing protein n=1 Tax=Paracoccus liaowanqingii TaxID=2560053 RepID=A0A4P7HJY7_9RHOB|nr:DUF952 domain-containing protein [Paracoccus liaowanqingii]QBX34415.1 DUF952 domain-containing protein [Paracoccus liaowanqingii]
MQIYKVLRAPEWAQMQRDGQTAGAPVDLADGYVHLSTAEQLPVTLEKHFANVDGLVLLACTAEEMGAELRWEPSRGGAIFPHLYRPLAMADVLWSRTLPLQDGRHRTGDLT